MSLETRRIDRERYPCAEGWQFSPLCDGCDKPIDSGVELVETSKLVKTRMPDGSTVERARYRARLVALCDACLDRMQAQRPKPECVKTPASSQLELPLGRQAPLALALACEEGTREDGREREKRRSMGRTVTT